jgi:hypothetical protein
MRVSVTRLAGAEEINEATIQEKKLTLRRLNNEGKDPVTALITSTKAPRLGPRRPISLSASAGIGYTGTWIISLSVGAPNPSVAAPASKVVAAFAGHSGPTLAMFSLAEGVAAIALVAVMTLVTRAGRRCGHVRAEVAALAFAIAVAALSWVELALGTWLISGLVPDRRTATAGTVYHAIMRIDGAKMFLLAAMALAISHVARTRRTLPRWLAPAGVVLAVALAMSGLGYLLLAPGLASTVLVSGFLLVAFVPAAGITLHNQDPADAAPTNYRTSQLVGRHIEPSGPKDEVIHPVDDAVDQMDATHYPTHNLGDTGGKHHYWVDAALDETAGGPTRTDSADSPATAS